MAYQIHRASVKNLLFTPSTRAPRKSVAVGLKPVSKLDMRTHYSTGLIGGSSSDIRVSSGLSHIVLSGHPLASRDTLSAYRGTVYEDEFQACKQMSDTELADAIQRAPNMGKLQDHNTGQHLIHWCVVTEKPQSIIAICNYTISRDEKDVQDKQGRTPLHLAVNGELEHITYLLLQLGADPTIMDSLNHLPLHLAACIGNATILRYLIEYCDDINAGGDYGQTAMHYAAAADHPQCIECLLEAKARMLVKNNNGTYPVHTAAKNGSARALEAMIQGAEPLGIDHRLLLSLKDREGQLPIHNAVNNGAVEAVSVCMKYGSSLLSEKDSGSTAVHYAAKQGNLALLQIMSAFNEETFNEALHKSDILGRTPLHWASMFDHHAVVQYLIKTSDVNTFDFHSQTPLLLAASGGCWDSLAVLLNHKETSTEVTDLNQRNFLHQAVIKGINVEDFLSLWRNVPNIKKRCNEQDKTGSTPLHYAAWNGVVSDVKALLNLGTKVNIKNKLQQNPFHMACKNGCYDVCLLLLNDNDGSRLKNDQDNSGHSPLHMAANKGYTKIVNVLLQRGAIISKSKSMSTALHLAAAGDHIHCVHSILSVHLYLLNMEDIDGNTALHLAAANGHARTVNLLLRAGAEITYNHGGKCFYDDALTFSFRDVLEVCIAHERWDEILSVFSQYHGQMIQGLIRYLPRCCIMVLDRCINSSSSNKNMPDYSVTYNFRHLQVGDEYTSFAKQYKLKTSPLLPIELMLEHNRDECLRHELVTIYLQQKWQAYGSVLNILDIGIYCLFLGSLTFFVMTHDPLDHHHTIVQEQRHVQVFIPVPFGDTGKVALMHQYPPGQLFNFTDRDTFDYNSEWFPKEAAKYTMTPASTLCVLIICIYSGSCFAKGIIQLIFLGFDCLRDIFFYLDLTTFALSIYFAFPYLFGYSTHTQWEAGAIAVFLAWFNFLVLCQRFNMVGLYIVMYIQIMKTLLQILFIFLVLMIAFGLAFYILQSHEDYGTNSTPILSMYRMLILLFEIDYVTTFLKPYRDGRSDTMHFPVLAFIFMALFLLFMPLLLVNLMIGMAVGDIQSVLKFAHQQKLLTLVNFYTKFERKLPFLMNSTPETLTIKPNQTGTSYKTWLMYLLGMKDFYVEKGEYSSQSYAAHDRIQPLQRSVSDLQRELGRVKRCLHQIMHKMGVHEEEYDLKHPFEDAILGALLHQSDEMPSTYRMFI